MLAHHPKLLKRWMVFGNHILFKSTLPDRERELLILRIAWRCRAEYEWGQHVVITRRCGVDDAEMARIKEGPDAPDVGIGSIESVGAATRDPVDDNFCGGNVDSHWVRSLS